MPIIIKRPIVITDLAEIWNYIAEDSETRADDFVDAIDRKFHVLAVQPKLGRERDDLAEGLRSFPVGRYIIFYLALMDGIEIVRVLHGARNIDSIFHPNPEDDSH